MKIFWWTEPTEVIVAETEHRATWSGGWISSKGVEDEEVVSEKGFLKNDRL
jgi:hypothetical protein